MIHGIKFVEGFPLEIYKGKPLEYKFTKGFNIIFSGNGAGKSVMLKFLKAYTGIPKAGWSSIVEPVQLASDSLPLGYAGLTPEKTNAIVPWDGRPAFYNAGDISNSQTWFFQNVGQSDDGITSEQEQFLNMAEKPSSGQFRLQKINKVLSLIGKEPNLLEMPANIKDTRSAQRQIDFIKSLPRNGRVTMLLDEPERSLSLPKQRKLLEVLMEFSENYQIIAACHSPFALELPRDKVNLIEIDRGYIEECDNLFNFNKRDLEEPIQQELKL